MKKLFIILSTILLFVGCKQFEPELCNVKVQDNPNCTYKLEKNYVPKYSFVKLQVFPNTGYYVENLSCGYQKDFFKSINEENTFYILIDESIYDINIIVKEKYKYSINNYRKLKNCSINKNKTNTYEGDIVTFTIIPDKYYYYEPSSVKVIENYYYESEDLSKSISFKQNETNPNEFSFIMPNSNVGIFVDMKFCVKATSQKESYKQNEKIVFDIDNHLPNQTYDLILSENYETSGTIISNDYIIIDNNVYLSNTYELSQNVLKFDDMGSFLLQIFPHGEYNHYTNAVFSVNSEGTPEGWRTIGIKEKHYYWTQGELATIALHLSNNIPTDNRIKVKYILENSDSSRTININKILGLHYDNSITIESYDLLDESTDLESFDTITIWIEDENLKYISRKITINLINQND